MNGMGYEEGMRAIAAAIEDSLTMLLAEERLGCQQGIQERVNHSPAELSRAALNAPAVNCSTFSINEIQKHWRVGASTAVAVNCLTMAAINKLVVPVQRLECAFNGCSYLPLESLEDGMVWLCSEGYLYSADSNTMLRFPAEQIYAVLGVDKHHG
jgi:hypothetical protein